MIIEEEPINKNIIELAKQGENCIENIIGISFEIFTILKDLNHLSFQEKFVQLQQKKENYFEKINLLKKIIVSIYILFFLININRKKFKIYK